MAKIIAVANQKGGVGKTTTCVNLACALHLLKKRILLVDMDPQGHSSIGFGANKHDALPTVYDLIINSTPISHIIRKTPYGDLLPASTNLAAAEVELISVENRHHILRDALSEVSANYDFIIIDCPPSLGMLTINSLCAAKSVLVPVDCGFYALEGLSALTGTMSTIKKSLNPDLDIEGVLLTMFDSRTNLSVQIAQEVKRFFPKKVFATSIPRNVRLAEAPSHGKPVMEYDKHSRGADCYMKLAAEIISKSKKEAL
ncbi:MAG: ParA family protein [Oscillospiraceae bacterium]|nr:ParA family protein [Oscillospiraceae bacterium]